MYGLYVYMTDMQIPIDKMVNLFMVDWLIFYLQKLNEHAGKDIFIISEQKEYVLETIVKNVNGINRRGKYTIQLVFQVINLAISGEHTCIYPDFRGGKIYFIHSSGWGEGRGRGLLYNTGTFFHDDHP